MNQSSGSRRSRRGYTGRAVTSNGTTAETHVYNHIPESEVELRVPDNWVHQTPVLLPGQVTASVPDNRDVSEWKKVLYEYEILQRKTNFVSAKVNVC